MRASLDVQAAINNAGGQLPKNLPNPPLFRKVNPADSPILILAVQSETLPLIEVNDFADNILSQQISQISGVSQVSLGGEQKRAIRVQADPARLAAMGMTLGGRAPAPGDGHGRCTEGDSGRRTAGVSPSMPTTSSPRLQSTTT